MKKVLTVSMLVLAASVLLASSLLLTTGCSISTANLSNVRVCDKVEGDQCSDMSTLDNEAQTFYMTAELNNAPEDTRIKIDWRYLSGEIGNEPKDIASVTWAENTSIVQSYLESSSAGWPRGEYEVVLSIQTDNADPIHKKFNVK